MKHKVKKILKYTWKSIKPRIAGTLLKKKSRENNLFLLMAKPDILIKTMWYW